MSADVSVLRDLCGRAVLLPGDERYDQARVPWNLAVQQHPAVVACPRNVGETAAVVKIAAGSGLRVAPQGTGHSAAPLGPLDDTVLLRTSSLTGVTIDPDRRTALVGAGAVWSDVVEVAAAHGLAALHGSSPDVGVVGYSLGGGVGWYSRKLGLQASSVTGAQLVSADGRIRWVDPLREPDLFWALRGGGGSFGVVTALEFRLYPIETGYAGMLAWDWQHAEKVLAVWTQWASAAPDEATTALRLLQMPALPEVPELVRGRQLVVIDGAVLDSDAAAEQLLAPLRALAPALDTFARVPATGLVHLHMDPQRPTPSVAQSALLADLPEAGIDTLLGAAGPGSGSSLLAVELRQLGGELGRVRPGGGAVASVPGQYLLLACGVAATPEQAQRSGQDAARVLAAMAPYTLDRRYLSFVDDSVDARTGYEPHDWERLRKVRTVLDPAGVFVANHPVPPVPL